jgi:hypothetical protein
LQTYRIKDLWGYGGFHPDFKGKLGASKVWQDWNSCSQPLRGWCARLEGLGWQECGTSAEKSFRQWVGRVSPREMPCGQ